MSIPTDPKKIRAAIRRYERKFEAEHDYRDGGGSRFLIGPYYLMVGDTPGALKHYEWFSKKFSDSSDEPLHTLSWALTLYRSNRIDEAVYRLKRAHLANPYLIPVILNIPHGQPNVRRGDSWSDEKFVTESPPEFLTAWTEGERDWLKSVWLTEGFVALVQEHIELVSALENERVGPRRTELVKRLFGLLPEWKTQKRRDDAHLKLLK